MCCRISSAPTPPHPRRVSAPRTTLCLHFPRSSCISGRVTESGRRRHLQPCPAPSPGPGRRGRETFRRSTHLDSQGGRAAAAGSPVSVSAVARSRKPTRPGDVKSWSPFLLSPACSAPRRQPDSLRLESGLVLCGDILPHLVAGRGRAIRSFVLPGMSPPKPVALTEFPSFQTALVKRHNK